MWVLDKKRYCKAGTTNNPGVIIFLNFLWGDNSMFKFSLECARCGTLLKKQVLGSNEFYYCRKCGSISSVAPMKVPAQSVRQQINVELTKKQKLFL